MPVVYHSLDFDGCFSNETVTFALGENWYIDKSNEQVNHAFLTANAQILKQLSEKGEDEKTVLLVGSNRQDPYMDFNNGAGGWIPSGSAYPRMEAFANAIGAEFNSFLLADLESDTLESGQTYRKLKDSGYLVENGSYQVSLDLKTLKEQFPQGRDDGSKVSLLFAQMQLAAMKHPEDEVAFNFYEDRKDIAKGLRTFFQKNPELIPEKVTFIIIGYSGPQFTQEQVQNGLEDIIMHQTGDLASEDTEKIKKEAQDLCLPVLIKITGGTEEFKLYRRDVDGEWGFVNYDGLNTQTLLSYFPKENGIGAREKIRKFTNDEDKDGKIVSYLKANHFLPIPLARKNSGEISYYNYGEPTPVASIKGKGYIPKVITDWLPAYQAMRHPDVSEKDGKFSVARNFTLANFIAQLSHPETGPISRGSQAYVSLLIVNNLDRLKGELTSEDYDELESSITKFIAKLSPPETGDIPEAIQAYINTLMEEKLSRLQGELTPEESHKLESDLIDLYKVKIQSDTMQLSLKAIEIPDDLKIAKNELCTAISEALQSPKLSLEDCQNLDKIVENANNAIDPEKDAEIKSTSITNLGSLSEQVAGKKSHTLDAVSASCAKLAVVAAIVGLVLAPTGFGLAIGLAVASALSVVSVATGLAAKHTKTDLAEKTHHFKDALGEIIKEEHAVKEPPAPQNVPRHTV